MSKPPNPTPGRGAHQWPDAQPGIRTHTRPGGTAQSSVGTTHACAPTAQWGLSVPQGGSLGLLQQISTDLVLKARELGSQPGIQAPQCGQGPPCLQLLVVPGSLASLRLCHPVWVPVFSWAPIPWVSVAKLPRFLEDTSLDGGPSTEISA